MLVRAKEVRWRSHTNRGRPFKTKVVLVAKFKLAGQQRFSVFAACLLKQIVKVGKARLGAELIEFHRRDGLDGRDHLGDAVRLGEGEERGVGAAHHGQDALPDENLVRGERLGDRLQRGSGKVLVVSNGQGWQILCVCVFRAFDTEVCGSRC